ncbi:MAG TPA: hypothetical protein VNO30_40665 [Kofleriaceae bacterium]|nr:hypothetical protein [Kofleriaceae bacterium]
MKQVIDFIEEQKRVFSELPLFKRLEGTGTLDDVRAFAPSIMFFTHSAKDFLRINSARFEDPEMRRIALQHAIEEKDHNRWLRADLANLDVAVDFERVYSEEHEVERDAAYQFIHEALCAKHDATRMATVWVLEMTGEALFSRTVGYFPRSGYSGRLVYYAQTHLSVEHSHVLFQEVEREYIERTSLTAEVRAEAIEAARRCYMAMTAMMNACERMIVRAAAKRQAVGASAPARASAPLPERDPARS